MMIRRPFSFDFSLYIPLRELFGSAATKHCNKVKMTDPFAYHLGHFYIRQVCVETVCGNSEDTVPLPLLAYSRCPYLNSQVLAVLCGSVVSPLSWHSDPF